jgi:gliding motility-associated-like protein
MEIFDRWGEKLYFNSDDAVGWDGAYRGIPCKSDVYVYKVSWESALGKKFLKVGHMSLIK